MGVTAEDLKVRIGHLIEEAGPVRDQARSQPPEFQDWTLRVRLLAEQVGGLFEQQVPQALASDYEPYWERLRQANEARGVRPLGNSVIYEWMVDHVLGLLRGLVRAVDDGLLTKMTTLVSAEI